MIKIIEPFQSKIKLHIGTEFLQSLWDRYVPVSSEAYEAISLIYLSQKGETGEERKQQVQFLINLIWKNILIRMNLRQNPILGSHTSISHSLERTTEYYFKQLKRTDFQIYQSVKRYTVCLEKAENENRNTEVQI